MAEITTTQSFSDGDTVTATKLNNIQANASIQPEAITNRTAETTVDQANDLLLMYDASATALKKISPSNLIKAGTASDFPITGNATIGGTLGVTGNTSVGGTLGVTGASTLTGNTSVGGTLGVTGNVSVNTNKFNVTAASGNTLIGGTIGVSGDATLSGNLSVTGNSVVKAGTAASPAIQPTGDTNTGIFFPASDTIAFSEGGTEAMRIDSSGNVGIGGTPSTLLHLQSTSPSLRIQAASGNSGALDFYRTASVNSGQIASESTNALVFSTNTSTNSGLTERLRIDSSGNVGIGTTSPSGKLHVNGQTYIQGTVSGGLASSTLIANASGQAQFWGLGPDVSTTGSMAFVVSRSNLANSVQALTIDSSGNVGIGVTSPAVKLDVSNGNIQGKEILLQNGAASSPALGTTPSWYSPASGVAALSTNAFERLRIDSSGRVGIGTNSPLKELQINATEPTIRLEESGAGSKRLELSVNSAAEAKVFATQSGSTLLLGTVGTERLRIDSSGNVLVNTTSNDTGAKLEVKQAASGTGFGVQAQGNDNPKIQLRLASGSTGVGGEITSNGGLVLSTSNTERLRITSGGDVGIGVTSPSAKLHVSGAILATGNITAYSDERIKTNWSSLPDGFIEKLAKVKSGKYERTDIVTDGKNETHVGVSAQSLIDVLPEAVVENKDEAKMLSVSYGNAALASCVELAKEIVRLKARISELELA